MKYSVRVYIEAIQWYKNCDTATAVGEYHVYQKAGGKCLSDLDYIADLWKRKN